MKTTHLYNTAHPLAESGKPIFIPFGEWNYDGRTRQRLDRAHGERIANELNAKVARGDPGIPVYQGHPDVPELASKYPDKGALGWVTKIELVNEDGRDGLALTVEWDRDPGRGFRWFSPYWLANGREGSTYVVDSIASIGLVNNPNIPEFRLANEEQPMKKKLNPAIIELAAKYDRLANEANFDESKHPRANDGKFTSGGGGSAGGESQKKPMERNDSRRNPDFVESRRAKELASDLRGKHGSNRSAISGEINKLLKYDREDVRSKDEGIAATAYNGRRESHRAAIILGLKYNPKTHQYE